MRDSEAEDENTHWANQSGNENGRKAVLGFPTAMVSASHTVGNDVDELTTEKDGKCGADKACD